VIYFVISATNNQNFFKASLVDWQIDRRNTMPEYFARRPLVLLHDGQWYVDADVNE